MAEEFERDRWYWDRRTRKALYPRRIDDTVEFVTVWHPEEVTDALDGGALVPLEDVGLDSTDTTFDLISSFRTPDGVTEGASGGGNGAVSGDDDSGTASDTGGADTPSESERDD